MNMTYCGTYKTKSGAQRYVARQADWTMSVNDKDVTDKYCIQPTVVQKAWHLAGPQYSVAFCVYYKSGDTK
jgi:hypothetical protein